MDWGGKMAKKQKKEKKAARMDEMGILKRDLTNTAVWIGIAVVAVGVLVLIQNQFSLFS